MKCLFRLPAFFFYPSCIMTSGNVRLLKLFVKNLTETFQKTILNKYASYPFRSCECPALSSRVCFACLLMFKLQRKDCKNAHGDATITQNQRMLQGVCHPQRGRCKAVYASMQQAFFVSFSPLFPFPSCISIRHLSATTQLLHQISSSSAEKNKSWGHLDCYVTKKSLPYVLEWCICG